MQFIFKPVTQLMANLRMPTKFALVGALFVAPLAWTTWSVVQTQNVSIATAKDERTGIEFLRPSYEVLAAIQGHRRMSNETLRGNASAAAGAAEAKDLAQKLITKLEGVAKTHADTLKADEKVGELKTAWSQLSASASKDPHENTVRHASVIDKLLDTFDHVGDTSQLVLDPDIDSFYLMLSGVKAMPMAAHHVADLRALGASVLAKGEITPIERSEIVAARESVKADYKTIHTNYARSSKANPDVAKALADDKVTPSEVSKFLDLIDKELLAKDKPDYDAKAYFDAGTAAMARVYRSADATLTELDRLLEARVNAKVHERNVAVGVSMALSLLAVYLMAGFYLSTLGGISAVRRHLRHIAAGDMREAVFVKGRDEIGDILRDLRESKRAVERVVIAVRGGSESVNAAASEITAGASDLAERTEKMTGELENTHQAALRITEIVALSAQNATSANALAEESASTVGRAGEVMQQVVGTMDEISSSSRKISDIIGVIDGIAFQTNILALNAAVEAARAGEQGRGFAVVAGEVRNLAQRSAGAAKEIKSLIEGSVEKVDHGSQLVKKAGTTMDEVVCAVTKVRGMIADIAVGADEQKTGVDAIHDAINRMQEQSLGNSALAEQSLAATQSLSEQAVRLTSEVASFQVGVPEMSRGVPLPVAEAEFAANQSRGFSWFAPAATPNSGVAD